MITKEKIRIYEKYNGDPDFYVKNAKIRERMVSSEEWDLLSGLSQDIRIAAFSHTDPAFVTKVNNRLKEVCDEESTILALRAIALYDV